MDVSKLGLTKGTWVVANCGNFPSEKNCKLVILAPAAQREDLIEAAASHAAHSHGHVNNPQLRKELAQMLDTIEL